MSTKRSSHSQVAFANPLSSTHEFLQACSTCFPRKGTFARPILAPQEIKMEIVGSHASWMALIAWSFFVLSAPGIYAFTHKPDLAHKCKRDVLLCKRKVGLPSEWTKVRPLPVMPSFNGPFVLCKGRKVYEPLFIIVFLVTNVLNGKRTAFIFLISIMSYKLMVSVENATQLNTNIDL